MHEDLLLIIPSVMVLIALFPIIFREKNITPINILSNIIGNHILREWKKFLENPPDDLSDKISNELRIANTYLSKRASALYKIKRNAEIEERTKFYKRRNEVYQEAEKTENSEILENILGAIGFALAGYIIFGILYAIIFILPKVIAEVIFSFPELIKQLLFKNPEMLITVIGTIAIHFIIVMLFLKTKGGRFQEALATGLTSSWSYQYLRDFDTCESQRLKIFNMISNDSGGSIAEADFAQRDPDINEDINEALPAPPGISEISISINENAFSQMKKDLILSRKMHSAISVTSFALFLLTILGSLYASIFIETATVKSVLGGVGIGTLLGTFTYFSLGNVRAAQLSLAIFESHLAEVNLNLREVDIEKDHNVRIEKRSLAWSTFRKGINSLWREEQKHMKFWKPK
jgi:hypothetical protein